MIHIIHEESGFVALDKPAGLSIHRGAGMSGKTLTDWLVKNYPEVKRVGDDPAIRPGIVHRLDKDTSGVMVVARTQEAFEAIKRLFQERRVEKTYLALVAGAPKQRRGIINAQIGRLASRPTRRGVGGRVRGGRQAMTEYRMLQRFSMAHRKRLDAWTLLKVKPKTGRTHQIRVHLASIGHPVAGDRIYGGAAAELAGLRRQFLHAWRLSFSYPEGRRWQFEAALPDDLTGVLIRLRQLRRKEKRATRPLCPRIS